MTRINITKYTKLFGAYSQEILTFAKDKNLKLPALLSNRGQALALMDQVDVRGRQYLTPDDTVTFFKQIGIETRDAIQCFNKATGIQRMKGRGIYCIAYPYEYDSTDLDKRVNANISGNRNEIIDGIKAWWRKNLTDVPNDEWQIGHLDPTIADASEKNLAYQPPLQGKYRNRFKWDGMFQRMWPTGDEWISKMDEYHTEVEQKKMFEALKKKFP